MANRSYLYRLSNRPASFADRPETIGGLSEWNYAIPFAYRVLMSGDPQLCASLVSDGFGREPPGKKTRLHAISSDFELGVARLKKLATLLGPMRKAEAGDLVTALEESIAFVESRRDKYLLLETIELDIMVTNKEDELKAAVEEEIARCVAVGTAIEAASTGEDLLATARNVPAFEGLSLASDFDEVDNPFGLSNWSEHLYFALSNRADFKKE